MITTKERSDDKSCTESSVISQPDAAKAGGTKTNKKTKQGDPSDQEESKAPESKPLSKSPHK